MPINPKKYSCYGLKKNSYQEFDDKKNFLWLENSPLPNNFSNGPSLIGIDRRNELGILDTIHFNLRQGRSRIFFRRGCTRLLLYFNTNKPHSFFWQNTSCIRKPQAISGGVRTPCTLPLDLPL